jgi:hypothetical protein
MGRVGLGLAAVVAGVLATLPFDGDADASIEGHERVRPSAHVRVELGARAVWRSDAELEPMAAAQGAPQASAHALSRHVCSSRSDGTIAMKSTPRWTQLPPPPQALLPPHISDSHTASIMSGGTIIR